MNGEFLQLLNLVEGGRLCNGQDCHPVDEEDVTAALQGDADQSSHLGSGECRAEVDGGCKRCADLRGQRIQLREHLHSRGHDFPVDVFVSN